LWSILLDLYREKEEWMRTRVSRVLMTDPLASFADAYRAELLERGYTPLPTVSEVRQAARFSRWLEAGRLTFPELSEGVSRSSSSGSAPTGVTAIRGRDRI
jgi:hypothetical protein